MNVDGRARGGFAREGPVITKKRRVTGARPVMDDDPRLDLLGDRLPLASLHDALFSQSSSYCCPTVFLRAKFSDQWKNGFDNCGRTGAAMGMIGASAGRLRCCAIFRQTFEIDLHIRDMVTPVLQCQSGQHREVTSLVQPRINWWQLRSDVK